MIKVVLEDGCVQEFDTLSEALDEVLDFSNATMIDTHSKTTYVYDEDAHLCLEHQFENTTVNPFSEAELELIKSSLEFVAKNSGGITLTVLESIINKI